MTTAQASPRQPSAATIAEARQLAADGRAAEAIAAASALAALPSVDAKTLEQAARLLQWL